MSEASTRGAANRPLSPHLQIYKPIPTMVMSILHRITGVALYGGMLILAWWLIAAASGQEYFDFVNGIVGSWLGLLILFGFTWALMQHMLGGIRHLIWDFGAGMEKGTRDNIAWGNVIGGAGLTVIVWIIGLMIA